MNKNKHTEGFIKIADEAFKRARKELKAKSAPWWAQPTGSAKWLTITTVRQREYVAEAYFPSLESWSTMDGLSAIRGDEKHPFERK